MMEAIRKVLHSDAELAKYKAWVNSNAHTFDAIVNAKWPDCQCPNRIKSEAKRLASKHYLESIV